METQNHCLSLLFFCIIISSCNEGKLPENKFIKEDRTIQCFEWINCDIQADASSYFDDSRHTFFPQISFKVYNYSNNIMFNPSYRNDTFIPLSAPRIVYSVLDKSDYSNLRIYADKKYGSYGIANVKLPGKLYKDVPVSPIALEIMTESNSVNETRGLMYVRVEYPKEGVYNDYIFAGNAAVTNLIEYNYKYLEKQSMIWFSPNFFTKEL